jgi:hypothetical protein
MIRRNKQSHISQPIKTPTIIVKTFTVIMENGVENIGPGLGQAHTCSRDKQVKGQVSKCGGVKPFLFYFFLFLMGFRPSLLNLYIATNLIFE